MNNSSNLTKIQKAANIFKGLTKAVMIILIVAASLTIIAGTVTLLSDNLPIAERIQKLLIDEASISVSNNSLGLLLFFQSVPMILNIVITALFYQYFKAEQKDGTPFTETGAIRVKKLGIICIACEIISAAFSAIAEDIVTVPGESIYNAGSIAVGLCLILISLVLKYGAELEKNKQ